MSQDGAMRGVPLEKKSMEFEVHLSPSTMTWGFTDVHDGYLLLGMMQVVEHMIKNRIVSHISAMNKAGIEGTVPAPGKPPVKMASVPRPKAPEGPKP